MEQKIMEKINAGQVKLRSRYVFLAEKFGVGGALVLMVFFAVFFFSLLLFYLRATDNLWYLGLGSRGFLTFLESFPYGLVAISVIFIFFAGFILKKSNFFYKRPFVLTSLVFLLAIIGVGSFFAFAGVAEEIERRAYEHPYGGKFFRPLMPRREIGERNGGLAGRIVIVETDFLMTQTPRRAVKVDIQKIGQMERNDFFPGKFIIAIGERISPEFFIAENVRVLDETMIPIIEREVRGKFGSFGEERKKCFRECALQHLDIGQCEQKCL